VRTSIMIDPNRLGADDWDVAILAAVGVRALHDSMGRLPGVRPDERDKVREDAADFLRWFKHECGVDFAS